MAPTGPERSSRWVLPTRCEPCACTLRRTVLLQSAERILQKSRPKRKTQLVAPLGCAPIARSLGHVLSVYPLIIPRTLQPAEVWGKALGNVCGESVDTFSQKNCSVLSDDARSRPAVARGTPHTRRGDRPVCGDHARTCSAGLCEGWGGNANGAHTQCLAPHVDV